MYLPQAFILFQEHLTFEKRFSKHTCIAYLQDLEQFATYLAADFEVGKADEVTTVMVRSWLASLRDAGMQPRSINRKLSAARSFFKFLIKNGHLSKSPAGQLSGPKAGKRLPTYVEKDKLDFLWTADVFPETWEGTTHRLALLILYQTGMRRSELCTLTTESIDFFTDSIKVLGKGSKERIIPVSDALLSELKSYLTAKKEQHFFTPVLLVNEQGIPLLPHHIYNAVKKYLGMVTTQQKKSPHVLRHSFATHLTNAGAELNAVKELLGHSSLASTQVYTHNTIEKLKKVHGKAHPKG